VPTVFASHVFRTRLRRHPATVPFGWRGRNALHVTVISACRTATCGVGFRHHWHSVYICALSPSQVPLSLQAVYSRPPEKRIFHTLSSSASSLPLITGTPITAVWSHDTRRCCGFFDHTHSIPFFISSTASGPVQDEEINSLIVTRHCGFCHATSRFRIATQANRRAPGHPIHRC